MKLVKITKKCEMGYCKQLMFLCTTLVVTATASFWAPLHHDTQPQVDIKWWGPGKPRLLDETVRNFKINISQEVLQDLVRRLEVTSPLTLQDANLGGDLDTDYMKKLVTHWKTKYNWREREHYLNKYPQFKTKIQGLDIHYIHVKPCKVKKSTHVLPLLLVHGWPGSVREFYKIIPLLTSPRDDANFVFEVVVPSLPGCGFSDRPSQPGLSSQDIAVVMKNLMNRLGFKQFYAHGGDWGAAIVQNIGSLFPESVLGLHSNTCITNSITSHITDVLGSLFPFLFYEEAQIDKTFKLQDLYSFLVEKFCCTSNQTTEPEPAEVGLRDSPAGLAAYIASKLSTWTDKSSAGAWKLSMTDLLDNVMIYWVSSAISNSTPQLTSQSIGLELERVPTSVPTGCSMFPQDLFQTPKSLLGGRFPNLVRSKNLPRGGHFPALEEPELLSNELWETVKYIEYENFTII